MSKEKNNHCPKCGEKLGLFYFKQNCPQCGTNLLYYDMENRLAADAVQAQKEWDAVDRLLKGIQASSIKSVYGVFRLVFYVLSTACMLLPIFKGGDISFDLISIIKGVMNGDIAFGALLTMGLFPTITMVLEILTTTVCLICSLFSYTKNGFKRDIILAVIQIVLYLAPMTACIVTGFEIQPASFLVPVMMIGALVMSILIGKKLKKQTAALENI